MADMKDSQGKWVDAVAKLIELTQEGIVKWSTVDRSDVVLTNPDNRIEIVYIANYLGHRLQLFRRYYENISWDELVTAGPVKYWDTDVALQIADFTGRPLWTFPHNPLLDDLYSAVQYKTSGAREFIDRLLSGDDQQAQEDF